MSTDGVVFDIDTISVQEIRQQANYPGLHLYVAASTGQAPQFEPIHWRSSNTTRAADNHRPDPW